MRKLFRFKYEPCNGTCYAYCIRLQTELRKLPEANRKSLVGRMVEAHNALCDNPDYSFGVDVDDANDVFVSHFRTPEKTDLYSNKDFSQCVDAVCKEVLATEIPTVEGACNFGDNGAEDLGNEILKFCEEEAYRELEAQHCECKEQLAA